MFLQGRIGRIVLRNALEMGNLEVVAINEYVSFISTDIVWHILPSPFIDLEYMARIQNFFVSY